LLFGARIGTTIGFFTFPALLRLLVEMNDVLSPPQYLVQYVDARPTDALFMLSLQSGAEKLPQAGGLTTESDSH
jgi:hypothetical protein